MYLAEMGRIIGRPLMSRIAKAMNRYRPVVVARPMALKRGSPRPVRSDRTLGSRLRMSSISALDTPCFAHFGQLPSFPVEAGYRLDHGE